MSTPEHDEFECGRVLAGSKEYDDVSAEVQHLVRGRWDELAKARLEQLDLASEFTKTGRTWSEVDDNGQVVTRPQS